MTATATQRLQVFKCAHCGLIVEVLHEAPCAPSCCGEKMTQLVENTVDASKEKHVPVIEQTADGILVKVGSIAHPMEEKHFIEWIELLADGVVYRQFLQPGDAPQALFPVKATVVAAREFCNLHGVWKVEA